MKRLRCCSTRRKVGTRTFVRWRRQVHCWNDASEHASLFFEGWYWRYCNRYWESVFSTQWRLAIWQMFFFSFIELCRQELVNICVATLRLYQETFCRMSFECLFFYLRWVLLRWITWIPWLRWILSFLSHNGYEANRGARGYFLSSSHLEYACSYLVFGIWTCGPSICWLR